MKCQCQGQCRQIGGFKKSWGKKTLAYVLNGQILGKITVYKEELAARGGHTITLPVLVFPRKQFHLLCCLALLLWPLNDYVAMSSFLGPFQVPALLSARVLFSVTACSGSVVSSTWRGHIFPLL